MRKQYEAVVGLEVHAQLTTAGKMFCRCAVSFGEPANVLTCPVCLGLPGALPVLNRKAVEYAVRVILAIGGEVNERSVFERKNYFYPDLPKGYQISQFEMPIGKGGGVKFTLDDGTEKTCGIRRVHLEEDAGKLLHQEKNGERSRIDLNRCGVPLIEIVSEADLRSPEEAYGYLFKLKQTLQYLEVCSGDMEKGHLRCDANVSIRREGETSLGIRTELKNLNSFRAVERALRFEIERQQEVMDSSGVVEQVTLMWDETKQVAKVMRTKEESQDYRYFPDPDLVDLVISEEWITNIRKKLPELADAKRSRFVGQYGIRPYDALVLTESRSLADFFEAVMRHFDDSQTASNWIQTELLGLLNENNKHIDDCRIQPEDLARLLSYVRSGRVSGKMAKIIFSEMFQAGVSPDAIIKEKGLALITDEQLLSRAIDVILQNNSDLVAKYRQGKVALFGFFVGQVMKATDGQADPATVGRLLKEKLGA